MTPKASYELRPSRLTANLPMRTTIKRLLALLTCLAVAGCGLRVPEIQETSDPEDGQRLVQSIVINITCEVQDALFDLYKDNPQGTFLDNWGVQMTLSLTNEEKGAASPSVSYIPPGIFSIAGGVTGSADASRIDKINSYYLVKDLKNARCPAKERPGGFFMMQSDLKLKEWLYDAVAADQTRLVVFSKDVVSGPFKENVISHEVKFDVITSGTVTPTFKIHTVIVNPTPPLLSTSRERVHDLVVTIGPANATYVTKTVKGKAKKVLVAAGPGGAAEEIHFANLIGSAVAQSLAGRTLP